MQSTASTSSDATELSTPNPPASGSSSKKADWEEMHKTPCSICAKLGDGHSWPLFIQHHRFRELWRVPLHPDSTRYEAVQIRTDSIVQSIDNRDEDIIQYNLWLQHAGGNAELTDRERRLRARIAQVAARVEERRTSKAAGELRCKDRLVDDMSGKDSYRSEYVYWENPLRQTRGRIRVATFHALRNSRWYLGHPSGQYIFHFQRQGLHTSPGDSFLGYVINTVCREDFIYMGQVPRNTFQLAFRLDKLKPDLMKLFISVLEFSCGEYHHHYFPEFGEICTHAQVTDDDITAVHEYWWQYISPSWPRDDMRKLFKSHPYICEAGFLMHALVNSNLVSPALKINPKLEALCRLATGLTVEKIAMLWEEKLKKDAFDQLFSGDSRQMLIYQRDLFPQNIHDFYEQDEYQDDPLNPDVRYAFQLVDNQIVALAREHRIQTIGDHPWPS
ncbi:ring finger [Fusarium albosuccineum]|uniref:Ring finger n=1 Tax=Fusarium albosuccineum TaxID=1237068 RepID=A0A8H4L3S3_9HYPO|nr:ring finger [Fusarium albosuccineum]